MPFYDLLCKKCNVVFEDFFSATAPVPTLCTNPECQADGYIQRLIPDVVHGRVPLTGHELKQSIKKQSAQIKEKVRTNEDLRANIIGESAYEGHLSAQQKIKDTYKD